MAVKQSVDDDLTTCLQALTLDEKEHSKVPSPLTKLYNKKYNSMTKEQLAKECQQLVGTLKLTKEEQEAIEKATIVQRESSVWFQQRSGRLTASQFHRIVHCKKGMVNLVKDVTSPNPRNIKVRAMQWGIDHETTAKDQYVKAMQKKHKNFYFKNVGLLVFTDNPYIAASPDGLIECDCCGKGVLEIKCPYKFRDEHPNIIHIQDKNHCLDADNQLKENHPYFYQIQGQMAAAKVKYGDFILWTKKGLLILRIKFNEEFWMECQEQLRNVFVEHVLPELLSRKLTTSI